MAYQVGHLVFVLDRQFVSLLFRAETYSVYSFAYSIISLFATMVATVSTVLFPMLKALTKENAMRHFSAVTEAIAMVSGGALICFYPIRGIVMLFLPEYGSSLAFLQIVFPTLLLTTSISVVGFTYFKILDRNFHYFLFGLSALILGVILNGTAYRLVGSPESISWASVITLLLWLLSIRIYFWKTQHTSFLKNYTFILCLLASFYLVSFSFQNIWLSAGVYSMAFCLLSLLFYHKSLGSFARQIFKKPGS